MKLIFILILLVVLCSGFYQHKIFPENKYYGISYLDRKNISGFSDSNFFPFTINAVIPWNNYFKDGEYLFDKWVKGTVVSLKNEIIKNDTYFFNYNKITKNLFLTINFKEIFEIDNREFKSFTLKDGTVEYCFEHQQIIDNHRFFQVLVKNNNYSLYKYISTKFRKDNNARAEGELVNWYSYYIIFPANRLYKEIKLKKKSITKNIYTEPEKIDAYFLLHQRDQIDEAFLVDLVNFLNK